MAPKNSTEPITIHNPPIRRPVPLNGVSAIPAVERRDAPVQRLAVGVDRGPGDAALRQVQAGRKQQPQDDQQQYQADERRGSRHPAENAGCVPVVRLFHHLVDPLVIDQWQRRRREYVARGDTSLVVLVQDFQILRHVGLPNRDSQVATRFELLQQRRRYIRGRRGHDDAVVGCVFRASRHSHCRCVSRRWRNRAGPAARSRSWSARDQVHAVDLRA